MKHPSHTTRAALTAAALSLGLAGCLAPAYPAPVRSTGYGWVLDEHRTSKSGAHAFSAASPEHAGPAAAWSGETEAAQPPPRTENTPPATGPTPLYARDGSVVADPIPGGTTKGDVLAHDMQPTASGRMYILELYQQAIDERDAFEIEVENLSATIAKLEQANVELQDALLQKDSMLGHGEGEMQALLAENQDLAARLATAQVRRLEAEKLLLESKLEWLRAMDGDAVATGAAPRPASGSPNQSATPASAASRPKNP